MAEENLSKEFRLNNIDGTRNYLIEKKKQNELMSRKHKKICTILIYTEEFLILDSTISSFASFLVISIGITSSAVGFKVCAIFKKKKKKHDEIVSLAKSKLNSMEVLIYNILVDSVIIHDEFVLTNNVLKEYNERSSKILVYLYSNIIILLEVQKKYRK